LVWPLLYSIRKGESAVDALLLKVPEVAEQLGISRAKVYELIAAGTLRSVKVGGCRRIRASDLRAFVDELSESA
jgi:excisionase family DNA binding protein